MSLYLGGHYLSTIKQAIKNPAEAGFVLFGHFDPTGSGFVPLIYFIIIWYR